MIFCIYISCNTLINHTPIVNETWSLIANAKRLHLCETTAKINSLTSIRYPMQPVSHFMSLKSLHQFKEEEEKEERQASSIWQYSNVFFFFFTNYPIFIPIFFLRFLPSFFFIVFVLLERICRLRVISHFGRKIVGGRKRTKKTKKNKIESIRVYCFAHKQTYAWSVIIDINAYIGYMILQPGLKQNVS